MSRVDTHTVLKLLAAEFERSKQEQIDRFLRDQEELNKRFNEFSVHGDNDKDDEGDSDTESIFTQRMSVYKSRPQTSMGWTELERERDFGFDQDSEGSANFNVSEPDADQWKSAVATAAKVVTAVDIGTEQANQTASRNADVGGESKNRFATRHKASQDANARQQHRGQQAAQPQGAHIPPGQRLVGLDNRILLTRRSSRPRTATGVQSSRGNVYKNQVRVDKEQDLEDPGARAGRPMRASAPATVSRVRRISWEPDSKKGSFLPDGRQTTGLLQNVSSPSYAVGRPKAGQQTAAASPIMSARNGGGAPRNSSNKELNANSFMIISSMNPQVRGSKESLTVEQRYTVEHGGKLPLEYASNKQEAQTRDVLLLRDVTAHLGELHPNKMDQNRTNSRRSVLKLPPLDAPGGAGGRGSPANQGYNNAKIQKPTPTSERNKQNEHGFLVG